MNGFRPEYIEATLGNEAERVATAAPKPKAVKIRKAAKLLDVCERSVRRYANKGLLESVHVAGLRLIKYASIEKLLGLDDQEAA